jgi:MFS family permease
VLFNVFSFPASGMVPVIGEGKLQLSPALIGLLSACEGAGATLGSILLAVYGRERWFKPYYWGGVLLCYLSILAFSAADWAVLAGLALFSMGLGLAGFSTMQATLIYLTVPPYARSRVMGLLTFCIGSAMLGFLHIGWLAGWLGPAPALAVMASEGLLLLLLVLWRWREIR